MTTWRIVLRLLRRDWHSGELYLLAAALVLTVAAVTAVGFFTDRIGQAMQRQGGELIAADLALEGSTPAPEDLAALARELGLGTARILEFPSVVLGAESPRLVQVKAVGPGYPLRGELRVQTGIQDPAMPSAAGPPRGEAWVESRLLHLLDISPGDQIRLGEADFTVARIIEYEPDRGGNLFQLAPRVLIHRADIPTTGLVTSASRVNYRLLVAGSIGAVEDFKRLARGRLPPNTRVLDARDARPAFSTAVERASRFLNLATLVTLLVAGAAIALASRRLVERQTQAVAVMRCLGAHRHLLTRIFLLRLLAFGLVASLIGCLLGFAVQGLMAALLEGWFGPSLPSSSLQPLAVGIGTGLITLLGFSVPPLMQLARVPPLLALRRDLGSPSLPAISAVGAAVVSVTLLVFWQAGDADLAWKVLTGVLAALISLGASVFLLIKLAAAVSVRTRGIWRLGLATLTRRPAGAVLQTAGFGLGILALLLLAVVRVDLLRGWQESLPEGAPNHFLINIQPSEVDSLEDFFTGRGVETSGLFPMIRGRLVQVNGAPLDAERYSDPRARRLVEREFNLSWTERLQTDNRIVAGNWWRSSAAPPQLSVEQGLARTLGLELGDRMGFWVDGRLIEADITSLREVQWDSFNVNFFVIGTPGLLAKEPATYVTSFHLPRERETLIPELVRAFPSVTLFDVGALMGQVRRIMDRGTLAVEIVFLFTLGAGLLVMYAGIQASLEARRAEHGVLRTLGAGRGKLLGSLAVEYAAAGLLAGLLASGFAQFTGWLLAEELFGLRFQFNTRLWALGVAGSAALICAAGTLATYPLLIRPPLETLRRVG